MADLDLPYGKTHMVLRLPESCEASVLVPRPPPALEDPREEVARALNGHTVPAGDEAVVVVSDGTRPVPNGTLLPPLLGWMEAAGIPRERITILVGTGLHRPTREAELPAMLGPEVYGRYRTVVHDAADRSGLVLLGETSRGTPIWINRHYVQSPIRVLTGMIEPHQYVGFTGGAKSVAMGLAGEDTIQGNHALLRDPRS
jgi:nickel-dependent lactate racemase